MRIYLAEIKQFYPVYLEVVSGFLSKFPNLKQSLAGLAKVGIWFFCFWHSPWSLLPLEDQLSTLAEHYAEVVALCWKAIPASLLTVKPLEMLRTLNISSS